MISLPNWAETANGISAPYHASFDENDIDAYEVAAIRLQEYSLTEISDGFKLVYSDAIAQGRIFRELVRANMYVLSRVTLNVPASGPMTTSGPHSDFVAFVDHPTGMYPQGWPVEFTSQGVLASFHRPIGAMGLGDSPEANFNDLAALYPFRTIPSCLTRCGSYSSAEACQCDTACEYYQDCCSDLEYQCSSGTQSLNSGGGGPAAATNSPAAANQPAERQAAGVLVLPNGRSIPADDR